MNVIQETEQTGQEWEKLFAKDTSDTGLSSKICKKLLKLNNKRTKKPD
jgi:hypothetical protein